MSDEIITQCQCGQEYGIPAGNAARDYRCKACGDLLKVEERPPAPLPKAEEPPANQPPLAPESMVSRTEKADAGAIAMQVVGELKIRDPDELMATVNTSVITRTFILSAILHVVLIGATSFGLYSDWSRFGIMMPAAIRGKKQEIAAEERQKALQEERDRREAERRAEAEKAAAAAPKPAAAAASSTGETSEYQKKLEEVRTDRPAASNLGLAIKDITIE